MNEDLFYFEMEGNICLFSLINWKNAIPHNLASSLILSKMLDIKEKIDVLKISAASLTPNFQLEKHEKDGFYFDYIEPTIFDVLFFR
jgi:hypothetical protein